MKYFDDECSFTLREFLVLVDRQKNGTPAGIGWGISEELTCDVYDYTWTVKVKLGTKGPMECPICGTRREDLSWICTSPECRSGEGSTLYPAGWENEYSDIVLN